MSTLKGAVIGAGYFSHFHYDAWNRIPSVDIVACCDIDAEKSAAVASQYDIGRHFSDYREMLDTVEVDFVDVITRPDTHVPICREVALRGLAIICQKPLAPTTADAHELVAATAAVPFMVHENFRFQPWYREIKTLLDGNAIGDRLHTLSFRNRAGDGHGPDAYLARQPYFQTMERFLIFEAGIHTVDTFRYLAGDIARVWCTTRKLNPVIAGEDAAMAIVDFQDGGQGLYDANRFNDSTAENPRYTFGELSVEADQGTIRLYNDGRLTIQKLGLPEQQHAYKHSSKGFAGDCVYLTQRHFVDCLITNNTFETNGLDYLKNIAAQDAMYQSAETGAWVTPVT